MFTQVTLVKNNVSQTCYVPSKFAKLGLIVKVQKDGEWDDGWKVCEVYLGKTIDKPIHTDSSIRLHRKRTGDSLPKDK